MSELTRINACPFCGNRSAANKGLKHGKRGFRCRGCGRYFRGDGFLSDRHFTVTQLSAGLSAVFSGQSFASAAKHVGASFGMPRGKPSATSVARWFRAYSDSMAQVVGAFEPAVGSRWTLSCLWVPADEGAIWVVSEERTGFVLSTLFTGRARNDGKASIIEKAVNSMGLNPGGISLDYAWAINELRDRQSEMQAQGFLRGYTISPAADDLLISTMLGAHENDERLSRVLGRLLAFSNHDDQERFLNGLAFMHNYFGNPCAGSRPTPGQGAGIDLAFGNWEEFLKWLQRKSL